MTLAQAAETCEIFKQKVNTKLHVEKPIIYTRKKATIILNPAIPYLGIVNGFRPGQIVRVQGRVNHNSHGFKIELLCGSNPNHDDVALHFNPRFSESVVIRNSRSYSTWGTEERQGGVFPFSRGQVFEVLILCERQHFKIAINGQHYAEFDHRIPVERITHLAVDGDITISFIQFDGTSQASAASPASAPPNPPEELASAPPLLQGGNYGEQYSYYGHPGQAAPPPAGFVPPPYPTGAMGAPPFPTQQPVYTSQGGYGPPPGSCYPSPPQQGHGYPYQGHYPPPQQPYGAYPQQPAPKSGSSGIMDTAGKVLAGVGLAGVASKIPGMMGGGGSHNQGYGHGYAGYPSYPNPYQGGHYAPNSGSSGFPGGAAGAVAGLGALGLGGALAAKVLKPKKLKNNKKMLKYGLPLAGVGLGGYALHKGKHGFRRSSSSSSSSSSSD